MMKPVHILVSSDTNFIPVLGVMLHSLAASHCGDRPLVVHLLCRFDDIDKVFHGKLENQISGYDNIELHTVDVSGYPEIFSLHLSEGFVSATYYRLLAPLLFPDLDKVLYLDCDLTVKSNIIELYDFDIGDNLVAACKDTTVIGSASAPVDNAGRYLKPLGITNALEYFNAGVLLMNLAKMRDEGLTTKMIRFAQTHECRWNDQDILNYFCQGRTFFLEKSWNSQHDTLFNPCSRYAPASELNSFCSSYADWKIKHFSGLSKNKPWNNAGINGADIWWAYAKQTEWYEILLQQSVAQHCANSAREDTDAVISRLENAQWLRDNLIDIIKWNETHTYASLVDLALEREDMHEVDDANLNLLKSSRLIFYGAGYWCRCFLEFFDILGLDYPAQIWDAGAEDSGARLYNVPVHKPEFDSPGEDDLVVITIYSSNVNAEISSKCKNALTHNELKAALARALWLKKEKEEYESFGNSSGI